MYHAAKNLMIRSLIQKIWTDTNKEEEEIHEGHTTKNYIM
jgi:hypothetical protein